MPTKIIVNGVSKHVEQPEVQLVISRAEVQAEATRRLVLLGAQYSREERETWGVQVPEALALVAAASPDDVAAPFLKASAEQAGDDVSELAATVLAKAEAFATASGRIVGARRKFEAMEVIPTDFANDANWV